LIVSFLGIPDGLKTDPFLKLGTGLYYIEPKVTANWYEANDRCHAMDAELVSFETIEEWIMINKYLKDNMIEGLYWTSGYDLGKQGRHVWAATGQPITLDGLWGRNQPDYGYKNENCDELGFRLTVNDRRGLNDKPCTDRSLFICERPQPRTTSFVVW